MSVKKNEPETIKYRGCIQYNVWYDYKKPPSSYTQHNVNIEEKGAFYIVTDDEGNVLCKKKRYGCSTIVKAYLIEEDDDQSEEKFVKFYEFDYYSERLEKSYDYALTCLGMINNQLTKYTLAIEDAVRIYYVDQTTRVSPDFELVFKCDDFLEISPSKDIIYSAAASHFKVYYSARKGVVVVKAIYDTPELLETKLKAKLYAHERKVAANKAWAYNYKKKENRMKRFTEDLGYSREDADKMIKSPTPPYDNNELAKEKREIKDLKIETEYIRQYFFAQEDKRIAPIVKKAIVDAGFVTPEGCLAISELNNKIGDTRWVYEPTSLEGSRHRQKVADLLGLDPDIFIPSWKKVTSDEH